ncbi:type VII secretion-associated protein [Mycobacterium sp. CBMA293]|uniref:type VII secretion-associated protein n=1 Tax=unclassified Mycolicibacterium TaxID=2636767 RepID=UPI0012DDF018|nr:MULTISPECIES: type VII secretion-associated protein [unclassified Mycolicibacterium]MUL48529.1 type VII secretion-associated protein [Mycolicibacterium sp. CBMA 360]MUL96430.1 type VII secretion-associated protein [Mycolicibacterium sp. CBMA 230]MUL61986.1 type VII secretion-associated protein [Mycolicibacterium sp. CBMA 335]MUL73261.1 type VII secretion-associated protein [Mycolicibacterium sp. CBMA 311]MUM05325.1 type VII secretion-associated protein [Mycolicibacterium sp. CBMA 213]
MTVVVVGPGTITGPGAVDTELVSAALECLDEQLGLLGVAAVPADHIWRDAMAAAIDGAPSVTVVCPTWWSAARGERVQRAAQAAGSRAVVSRRTDVLRGVAGEPDGLVVELGEDLVVMSEPGSPASVLHRDDAAVIDDIVACAADAQAMVIDAPFGVPGAPELAAEVQARLQDRGITSQILTCTDLLGDADSPGQPAEAEPRRSTKGHVAVVVTAGVAIAAAVGLGLSSRDGSSAAVAVSSLPAELTWLVEGRFAVQIPAGWTVERLVSGSGSPRLQVVSPEDRGQVLHVTQSVVPPRQTLDQAATSLREAAARLPDGVITDFDSSGLSAGRSAIRYREVRGGRTVDWSVILDGPVRIAVGCQGIAARPHCDTAIRTAHRVD